MVTRTIAVVEDERDVRENYRDWLERQGYQVAAYADLTSARAGFATRLPDLVLLDVALGNEPEGGFDLCRELRARSATLPILFLSAHDSDLDRISGLRLGADDYLPKTVSLPFLQARIQALFRRLDVLLQTPAQEDVLRRGPLVLNGDTYQASWNGQALDLTLTEFWILRALAEHPGHVKKREQLLRDAQVVVEDNTITSHVKRLRRKFYSVDPHFDRIETVYGLGYRWRP